MILFVFAICKGPGLNTDNSQDESAESFAFALINGSLGVFELRGRRVRDFRFSPISSDVSWTWLWKMCLLEIKYCGGILIPVFWLQTQMALSIFCLSRCPSDSHGIQDTSCGMLVFLLNIKISKCFWLTNSILDG